MLEYRNIIINTLPKLLLEESSLTAICTIEVYMKEMVKNTKTKDDLKILNSTIRECSEFIKNNNLKDQKLNCLEWQMASFNKSNEIHNYGGKN